MARLVALAVATAACVAGAAAPASAAAAAKRYVVVFNQPNGLPSGADRIVAAAGGRVVERIEQIGVVVAESAAAGFEGAIEASSQVKVADESVRQQMIPTLPELVGPDDENNNSQPSPAGPDPQPGSEPLYHQQWDKMRINASNTGSYSVQQGRKEVIAAVLDTGVEMTHGDLLPNLNPLLSRSFVPYEQDIDDKNGHGSWTSSAVAAPINGFGISGVAPNVTLVHLKVLDAAGSGEFAWVAAAIVYAADIGADVLSMSFGGFADRSNQVDNAAYIATHRAIQYARSKKTGPAES